MVVLFEGIGFEQKIFAVYLVIFPLSDYQTPGVIYSNPYSLNELFELTLFLLTIFEISRKGRKPKLSTLYFLLWRPLCPLLLKFLYKIVRNIVMNLGHMNCIFKLLKERRRHNKLSNGYYYFYLQYYFQNLQILDQLQSLQSSFSLIFIDCCCNNIVMIINEGIMPHFQEKIEYRRYSTKREAENLTNKHKIYSKTRYFTERAQNFVDYQVGKKIILDLPQLQISKLKNKSTAFNELYIATDKHKYHKNLLKQMQKMKNQLVLPKEEGDETFYSDENKCRDQEKHNKAFFRSNKKYSMGRPSLSEFTSKKELNSEIFKKKILKIRHSPSPPKAKRHKTDDQYSSQMANYIKIYKKQLTNAVKSNKIAVNKSKITIYEIREQQAVKKKSNSRIQAWPTANNEYDIL